MTKGAAMRPIKPVTCFIDIPIPRKLIKWKAKQNKVKLIKID